MSTISCLLKRLQTAGFSQSEISRRSGISQPTLSRWCSGHVAKAAEDALRLRELVGEVTGDAEATPPTDAKHAVRDQSTAIEGA